MKRFFKVSLLLFAMSISLVACRENNEADDLTEGADVEVSDDGQKIKIKTDDKKIKIKTDDDGNVKKKVKIDGEDN